MIGFLVFSDWANWQPDGDPHKEGWHEVAGRRAAGDDQDAPCR